MPDDAAPPTPVGPYTPVVRVDGWLICSGQLGLLDGELAAPDTVGQLNQAIENLKALLQAEHASLSDVVKTTVFLVDIAEYGAMNDAYVVAFGAHRPARSAVAVSALPRGARVEIEAWARVSTS